MSHSVRPAVAEDHPAIRLLLESAFPDEDLSPLVDGLRIDPTSEPVELVAVSEDLLGHVLFTRVWIEGAEDLRASILSPLCVAPGARRGGVGSALVEAGLEELRRRGKGLCFVLGDPAYYGRFGFHADTARDLAPPHELPPAYEPAWQALWLGPSCGAAGRVVPAAALARRELWTG